MNFLKEIKNKVFVYDIIIIEREVMKMTNEEKFQKGIVIYKTEDDVVALVQGMSNKQIAEHLFISVNTVITHRRNIARKLQIHSSAGLTIYAIVNGLVDISSVKL